MASLDRGEHQIERIVGALGLRVDQASPWGGRATSGRVQGPDQLSMHPFSLAHHRGRSQDRSRYPGSAIRPSTIVPRPDSLETSSVPPIASRRSTMPCIPVP